MASTTSTLSSQLRLHLEQSKEHLNNLHTQLEDALRHQYWEELPKLVEVEKAWTRVLNLQGRSTEEMQLPAKFDPNYCSPNMTLESPTKATCAPGDSSAPGYVLGTKSKSFSVKLISGCSDLLIGFAPRRSCTEENSDCAYLLYCGQGNVCAPGSGGEPTTYIDEPIKDGSIVECTFNDEREGIISYKVDGRCCGCAFSRVGRPIGDDELLPAFLVFPGEQECKFEIVPNVEVAEVDYLSD